MSGQLAFSAHGSAGSSSVDSPTTRNVSVIVFPPGNGVWNSRCASAKGKSKRAIICRKRHDVRVLFMLKAGDPSRQNRLTIRSPSPAMKYSLNFTLLLQSPLRQKRKVMTVDCRQPVGNLGLWVCLVSSYRFFFYKFGWVSRLRSQTRLGGSNLTFKFSNLILFL